MTEPSGVYSVVCTCYCATNHSSRNAWVETEVCATSRQPLWSVWCRSCFAAVRTSCKSPKQSVSLVIQQSVPHRPDHHRLLTVPACPTTSNFPDPSGMNRRPSLITNQGIDKCL